MRQQAEQNKPDGEEWPFNSHGPIFSPRIFWAVAAATARLVFLWLYGGMMFAAEDSSPDNGVMLDRLFTKFFPEYYVCERLQLLIAGGQNASLFQLLLNIAVAVDTFLAMLMIFAAARFIRHRRGLRSHRIG